MKSLLLLSLLLSLSEPSLGQSPFDGNWLYTEPIPQAPAVYSLAKGMFRCTGCLANMEIRSDGSDHRVTETDYWDTVNLQDVDAHTVVFIAKKTGRTMFTEIDAVSPDGNSLTQIVKDTTEAETVTIETLSRRVKKGRPDSHLVSGSWQAYKASRSKNGSVSRYKCTTDGFSAETPLGENFNAKFDGKDYPVEDDPGRTMISAKLLSPNTVELTSKRNGRVIATKSMSVANDGKSIHVVFKNDKGETISTFNLQRQP